MFLATYEFTSKNPHKLEFALSAHVLKLVLIVGFNMQMSIFNDIR